MYSVRHYTTPASSTAGSGRIRSPWNWYTISRSHICQHIYIPFSASRFSTVSDLWVGGVSECIYML